MTEKLDVVKDNTDRNMLLFLGWILTLCWIAIMSAIHADTDRACADRCAQACHATEAGQGG